MVCRAVPPQPLVPNKLRDKPPKHCLGEKFIVKTSEFNADTIPQSAPFRGDTMNVMATVMLSALTFAGDVASNEMPSRHDFLQVGIKLAEEPLSHDPCDPAILMTLGHTKTIQKELNSANQYFPRAQACGEVLRFHPYFWMFMAAHKFWGFLPLAQELADADPGDVSAQVNPGLRRSVSSWVSPGPRVPMPPPSCDMARPRPTRRGSKLPGEERCVLSLARLDETATN